MSACESSKPLMASLQLEYINNIKKYAGSYVYIATVSCACTAFDCTVLNTICQLVHSSRFDSFIL